MKTLRTGLRRMLEAFRAKTAAIPCTPVSSGAAPLTLEEPAEAAQPNKALPLLALGLALTGMAGWASVLAIQGASGGADPLRAFSVAALALALVGVLAGTWAWWRWQLNLLAHRAAEVQLNRFHAVMSQTNRLILRRPDPRELFEGVCEVCVEAGHMDLAVVDMVESGAAHRVTAKTLAGLTAGASPALLLDGERVRKLMLLLVRHAGSPVVVDDAYTVQGLFWTSAGAAAGRAWR